MDNDKSKDPADRLYAEGKQYDWKQDQSPAAAALARAYFQQATEMGNKAAKRALAHMIYEGRGGAADKEHGLLLLWSAFRGGDSDALEELSDLLASYADEEQPSESADEAAALSPDLEGVRKTLSRTAELMFELAKKRTSRNGG